MTEKSPASNSNNNGAQKAKLPTIDPANMAGTQIWFDNDKGKHYRILEKRGE